MPPFYQPRRGGVIEVVCDKGAEEVLVDLTKEDDSTECGKREEEYINEYIQYNSKRIQVERFFDRHFFFLVT